jgi:hypothetical protein
LKLRQYAIRIKKQLEHGSEMLSGKAREDRNSQRWRAQRGPALAKVSLGSREARGMQQNMTRLEP